MNGPPGRLPQKEFPPDELRSFLDELLEITGYNFLDYSPATLRRRLHRRLVLDRLSGLEELRERIRSSPEYAVALVQDFSIHVTEMFRDPAFFRFFRERIVPELRGLSFVRIWIAGCSTGEEAFSLALLLDEEGMYPRCRIYATDMNEAVLAQAVTGAIPVSRLELYAQNYVEAGGRCRFEHYLDIRPEGAFVREPWLERIMFSHHNLTADRSFNEFHVIFCRNVLIYFNKSLQDHVHELLAASLAVDGYLALGDKETIRFSKCASQYGLVDPRQKIFRRIR